MTTVITLPDGFRVLPILAVTLDAKHLGLRGCTRLKPECGMLFVWTDERPRAMTMEGCLIPLDIVWLDRRRKVLKVVTGYPGSVTYDPSNGAMFVLELGAGECEKHGVVVGSTLKF